MNVILLGAPGAGKGTQGRLLAEALGVPKIATGDLLRSAAAEGTPMGLKAKDYMDKGLLVPDEVMLDIIEAKIISDESEKGVIMDGFPRTIPQAEAVGGFLDSKGERVDLVLQFDVPDEELVKRMTGRSAQEGRSDDTAKAIFQRLQVYKETTAPLIEYYEERGVLVHVDAVGEINEVFRLAEKAVTI